MESGAARSRTTRLRYSLRSCTVDGALHAVMIGSGETYFPAFALMLGASAFEVGVLATFPILAGAAFQLVSPAAAGRLGEKRWVVASALLQALTFVPIALSSAWPAAGYTWLLASVCAYWMLALGINPPWNAWMGRMIPTHIRGRYFARRNVAIHSCLFLSVVAAGLLIHAAEHSAWGSGSGFMAAFAVAAASRFASVWFLVRQDDPPVDVAVDRPSVKRVVADFVHQPYGRLIALLVLMNGAVHVSAAYFTPFMLQGLGLSYARFTILTGVVVVARILASPYWGELARSYGNRRILQVAATLITPLSALWVISDNYAYLLGLQLVAGFAWSGFELATFLNFFDCTDRRNRARVLSLYNLLNGVAIVSGSVIGGSVLEYLGRSGYAYIFIASSFLRVVALLALGRGVGQRRAVAEHSFRDVFVRVLTLRPGQGADTRPVVMGNEHIHPPRSR